MVGLTGGRFTPGKVLRITFPPALSWLNDVSDPVSSSPLLTTLCIYLFLGYSIRV
jgi:hypothetical protein